MFKFMYTSILLPDASVSVHSTSNLYPPKGRVGISRPSVEIGDAYIGLANKMKVVKVEAWVLIHVQVERYAPLMVKTNAVIIQ